MTMRSPRRRSLPLIPTIGIGSIAIVAIGFFHAALQHPRTVSPSSPATFVGRAACAACHASEMRSYAGSRHDLAMQPADSNTVLGDFSGVSFRHFDITSRFDRRGNSYVVTTDGPGGKLAEFPIAYTFGVYPLQQYLIALPGGRYQALSIAWDSRSAAAGGQRWFHLYPNERIPAGDILHWTGPEQNWNYMCAECHSTNLEKGWSPATHAYATTWSEIDVSCEACHGPASAHVSWAKRAGKIAPETRTASAMGLAVDLREPTAAWIMNAQTGIARREHPRTSETEVELCARCHARRTSLADHYLPGQPLLSTHKPALLEEGLYYADGQQLDEVYEYGSFLQSRMYAAGVSCGDCHDPHSLRLAAAPDQVCARCHSPARFATAEHHHHRADSKGASCVACHMPTRDYMVIDARADHSFRVPRPDLSKQLGTPNACTGCHGGRSADWAQAAVATWYPRGRWTHPHYGQTLDAGRRGLPGAGLALARLISDADSPGIARATAAALLASQLSPASLPALEIALRDRDGLVRSSALDALGGLPPLERVRLAQPLLGDSLRGVRIEAVGALAADAGGLTPAQRRVFAAAAAEYRAAQATNADRPEAHSNLGALAAQLGDRAGARREYEEGLAIGPWFAGLWLNLADLLREEGRDAAGDSVLRRGLVAAVDKAPLHHALGLNLARQHRLEDALPELRRATELAPAETRYAYAYGVALLSTHNSADALAIFEAALARRPADLDLLVALATANRDLGRNNRAVRYARRLVDAAPGDPGARRLLEQLEAGSRGN